MDYSVRAHMHDHLGDYGGIDIRLKVMCLNGSCLMIGKLTGGLSLPTVKSSSF